MNLYRYLNIFLVKFVIVYCKNSSSKLSSGSQHICRSSYLKRSDFLSKYNSVDKVGVKAGWVSRRPERDQHNP